MSEAIRVGVNGARGRMGRAVCEAVDAADGLVLAATVDVDDEPRVLAESGCDVVVDFTTAEAARVTLPWLAMHGIHAVVGTTGFTDDDVAAFRDAFGDSGPANCLIAPNFAISAVLMMRFAEMAAPHFGTAEVIEFHHDAKIDAPSGTAVATAERMDAARGGAAWNPDPTQRETYPGARGGRSPGGTPVHSVRMHGMVAHQEVIFGAAGQSLTIRQDSYDRSSFMPGVVLACRRIADHPGVTLGLDPML